MYDELVERLMAKSYTLEELSIILPRAADAIEELSRRCEQFQYMPPPAWIPVTERLPELGVSVLTYCPAILYIEIQSLEKHVGNLHWENQHGDWQDLEAVDLWMPLPELPKEEE